MLNIGKMSVNGILDPFRKNHIEFHLDEYDDKDVAYVYIYDNGHYIDMETEEDKVMALLFIKYYWCFRHDAITKEMVRFYLTILDKYPKFIQNWIISLAELYLEKDSEAFPDYKSNVNHTKRYLPNTKTLKELLVVYPNQKIIDKYPRIKLKKLENEYSPLPQKYPSCYSDCKIMTGMWFKDYPHTISIRKWYLWHIVEIRNICNDMGDEDFSYLQFDRIKITNSFNRCKNMKKLPYLNRPYNIFNSFNDCPALENVDFNIFDLASIQHSFNDCPLLYNAFNDIEFQGHIYIMYSFNKSSNVFNNCVFLSCTFDKKHRFFKKIYDIIEDTNVFRNCKFNGDITFTS